MPETACHHCDRTFDTDVDAHYRLIEPDETKTTVLYFCSASCAADNAGLFDE